MGEVIPGRDQRARRHACSRSSEPRPLGYGSGLTGPEATRARRSISHPALQKPNASHGGMFQTLAASVPLIR